MDDFVVVGVSNNGPIWYGQKVWDIFRLRERSLMSSWRRDTDSQYQQSHLPDYRCQIMAAKEGLWDLDKPCSKMCAWLPLLKTFEGRRVSLILLQRTSTVCCFSLYTSSLFVRIKSSDIMTASVFQVTITCRQLVSHLSGIAITLKLRKKTKSIPWTHRKILIEKARRKRNLQWGKSITSSTRKNIIWKSFFLKYLPSSHSYWIW